MTDYYDEVTTGGDPVRMDGWRDRIEQWLRFEAVCRGLDVGPEADVVDLGCGTGRLREYLGDGFTGRYVGVDIRREPLEVGREDVPDDYFLQADWSEECIEERGPFDVAVAIGTMVDGRTEVDRRELLARLVGRLDDLGQRGWALVALDQDVLEESPVRGLDPALRGARRGELEALADRRDVEIAVTGDVVATDLVAVVRRDVDAEVIEESLEGDQAHRAVLERAERKWDDFDEADRVRLWLVGGRIERARKALNEVPERHPDRQRLERRLEVE